MRNKRKVGRPSKIDNDTVRKLELTASLDCTVTEMCFYADISRDTYYIWMKKDKQLSDRLTALRNKPILKARQEVIKGLDSNPEFALKYLERKLPEEFGIRRKIQHEGEEFKQIIVMASGKVEDKLGKRLGEVADKT